MAVTSTRVDFRSIHATCRGYSALLDVLSPTGGAAVNGASFSHSSVAGGRIYLVPKCGVTILCRIVSPKFCESLYKSQLLPGERSSATISSADSCQPL